MDVDRGDTIARYRIAALIARGGMGAVYRATDVETGRLVALKVLPTSGDGRSARFARERAIAATLDHPHVVAVYDTGVDVAGRAYIAMRLVRGSDLARVLAGGPIAMERAVAILEQVAQALDAAHDRGLVHRDVKPGNILLERSNGLDEAFLSDFGLVKELVVDDALSTTGALLGTPDYVPPEIVLTGSSDARGDVYALGCVLFEMLTGAPPFRRESEVATLWAHVNDEPPSLTEMAPDLPAGMDVVIARALAKEPEDRYGSAGDLAVAARAAASGEVPERAPTPPRAETARCPYKGLAAFGERDADVFFGREELVARLAARLQESPFLAVVGASGSGKSSLVRAGLLPALAEPAAVITPGPRPVQALEGATAGTVLVVDQFEELFTLCHDETERRAFVARLLADARPAVIVLRADFYARCTENPQLASLLERNQAVVGPMTEAQLRDAIEKPAQRVGLHLERRLLETAIRDVSGQQGALPLLSHALVETWNRRVGRTLTLAGYIEAGGVEGSLARTAQAAYDALDDADRALARGTFLRLTALGEGTEDTRRRVAISELLRRPDDEAAVARLLDRLAAARLVSVDASTAELTHEALIRHWPMLQTWLNEDREGRRTHRRITELAQEWVAADRDPGALLRGGRLASAAEWAVAHDDDLNEQEREFVAASSAAEEQEVAAVRRRNRRLRTLVVALAVLLAAAAVAAVVAVRQTGVAQDQQAAAEAQSRVALSRGLAGQAQALLSRRLDQALLLAVEADRVQPTDESLDALRAVVQRTSGLEGMLSTDKPSGRSIAISRDGRLVAVGDASGKVTLWDAEKRRQVGEPIAMESAGALSGLVSVVLSPGANYVAALTEGGAVWLAKVREPHDPRRFSPASEDSVFNGWNWEAIAFSQNGLEIIAVGGRDRSSARVPYATVRRWWIPAHNERKADVTLPFASGVGIAVSGDGTTVAIARRDAVAIAGADTGAARTTVGAALARRNGRPLLEVSHDGSLVGWVTVGGRLQVVDASSGRLRLDVESEPVPIDGLAFSADGRRLTVGRDDGNVRIYDIDTDRPVGLELRGHAGRVLGLAVASTAHRLASIGADGLPILQSTDGQSSLERIAARVPAATSLAVSPDGAFAAVPLGDTAIRIVALRNGATVASLHPPGIATGVAFSADGRYLAAVGSFGHLWIWDATSWRRLARSFDAFSGPPIAFSRDGQVVVARGRPGTGDIGIWRRGEPRAEIYIAPLPRRPLAADFSADGHVVAVAFSDGVVRLIDVTKPRSQAPTRASLAGPVTDVAYSPDGDTLVSAGRDGVVRFDTSAGAGAPETALSVGGGAVSEVAFDGSGGVLQTLSEEGLRFWDVERRVPIGDGLAFPAAPGASRLAIPQRGAGAVVLWDGLITRVDDLLWTSDRRRLIARACALAGRSLTKDEFAQFEPGTTYAQQCPGAGAP